MIRPEFIRTEKVDELHVVWFEGNCCQLTVCWETAMRRAVVPVNYGEAYQEKGLEHEISFKHCN